MRLLSFSHWVYLTFGRVVTVVDVLGIAKVGKDFAVCLPLDTEKLLLSTFEHHIQWIGLFLLPCIGKAFIEDGKSGFSVVGNELHVGESDSAVRIRTTMGGDVERMPCFDIESLWENKRDISVIKF